MYDYVFMFMSRRRLTRDRSQKDRADRTFRLYNFLAPMVTNTSIDFWHQEWMDGNIQK